MPLFQACPDQKLSLSRSELVLIRVAHCTCCDLQVHTIGDWTADFYGKHWESDQNVVTAQLLRFGICSMGNRPVVEK